MADLIDIQGDLFGLITRSYDNLIKLGLAKITSGKIVSRLENLEANWRKFQANHDTLIKQKRDFADNIYFKDSLYDSCEENYLNAKSDMIDLKLKTESSPSTASSSSSNQSVKRSYHLPRIELPQFRGKFSEWTHFRDLFTSMIISNQDLPSVEKLHYLKMSLSEEPAQLLKNVVISEGSFDRAWDILVERYENKRLLIDSHLHKLFDSRTIKTESSKDLKRIIAETSEALGALETLECPVKSWDVIIVFLLLRKLDTETIKEWEKLMGTKKDPAKFSELQGFLLGRVNMLEAIEHLAISKKPQPSPSSRSVRIHTSSSSSQKCSMCQENHFVSYCKKFNDQSPSQKKQFVSTNNLCFNCLGPHLLKACRSAKSCRICKGRHHSTLHTPFNHTHIQQSTESSACNSSTPSSSTPRVSSNIATHLKLKGPILLATALVDVISDEGMSCTIRALIDQGSETSFVSESVIQNLQIKRRKINVSVSGIGNQKASNCKGLANFAIRSKLSKEFTWEISAIVLPKLTSYLPPKISNPKVWKFLKQIPLADPDVSSARPIELILGADIYTQIIEDGILQSNDNPLIAQRTKLGWIISGPLEPSPSPRREVHGLQCCVNTDLHDLLQKFWDQENPQPTPQIMNSEEKMVEDHFLSTTTRNCDGRFVVRLPLFHPPKRFGDTFSIASKLLENLETRFRKNPNLRYEYFRFMREYHDLGHMQDISHISTNHDLEFYLPHHGISRNSSTTTKFRIVFNGSQKSASGLSLNEYLSPGPKLQTDISNILLRWRRHQIAFSADIEKMYRQILVHPSDRPLQKILWRESESSTIKTYQLNTVTYGLTCAPYLALRCIQKLAEEHQEKFPQISEILRLDTYVDDILSGADDVETASEKIRHLNKILASAGFTARKWLSNDKNSLCSVPSSQLSQTSTLSINDSTHLMLGISWKSDDDSFQFDLTSFGAPSSQIISKRTVLSQISKIFDPLGWISPITIVAKIFMQSLWLQQISWDECLPPNLTKKWLDFQEHLLKSQPILIPRWIGLSSESSYQLHGFCDASKEALAATLYLRVVNPSNETKSYLLASKTKVTPLKPITIPRLELSAALLLVNLTKQVRECLNLSVFAHLWSDSSIVLSWIQSPASRWKEFVRNRVAEIQLLPAAQWHHVAGKQNPADVASRGLTPVQLNSNSIWWSGPSWLQEAPHHWPASSLSHDVEIPEAVQNIHTTTALVTTYNSELLERYSNLNTLLRITSWCFRFVHHCKTKSLPYVLAILTPEEITASLYQWVRFIQRQHFQLDIASLENNRALPKTSSLYRLNPFIDGHGLLRLTGRLKFANLSWDEKHPMILPRRSHLTTLVIDFHHRKQLHGGTQITTSSIRHQFWIIGGRQSVRSFIHRCLTCVRHRSTTSQQLMGQLPVQRVQPSRPFYHTGVDYAGPIFLRTMRGRGGKLYKAYLVIFVCMATSAIHLEVATDYTSSGFIAAYRRFISRRGICATLSSDQGTNFIGADRELQSLFRSASEDWRKIASSLSDLGTQWKFNPPSAPHFGGKWEAVVKSVKHHLKRAVGDITLTFEEMATLLTQIEAILNSRPLCPLSDDPNSSDILTPAHFLIGTSLNSLPEPFLTDYADSKLSRWQLLQKVTQTFWKHWSSHYLQHLQNASKWFESTRNLQPGDLVLLKDSKVPAYWPLARVIKTHLGPDDKVRVATIKTSTTTLRRPITKLCLLPT